MKTACLVLAMMILGAPAWAEEGSGRWAKRLWKVSLAAVAASSVMDMQSSLGKHETNGMLANRQGVFSAQGIGLKLALAGGALGVQHYWLMKHPAASGYKTGAFINFAVAGVLSGAAIHNYGVRPVAP